MLSCVWSRLNGFRRRKSEIGIVLERIGEYDERRSADNAGTTPSTLPYLTGIASRSSAQSTGELMPTELVFLGGILTVAVGGLFFMLIRRHKPTEPLHFR
jgi:hypothetical protein